MSHSAENFRRGILYCCINFGYRKSLDKRGGGEYEEFPSEFFCLTLPKNSAGVSFTVALISGVQKVWIRGVGGIKIFHRKFFASQCRKFLYRNPLLLHYFRVSKSLDKRGGVSRFSVKIFLSHSAEKFRRGILYCCINFGYRKSSEKRRGEYQDIPSKIFCLTVPKISTGESFTVALISGVQKVWIRGGGGVSRFSVKIFLSHSAEKFRWGILYCCINFGYRKSSEKRRGEYQDIPSKIFCLTVPKISTGESFTVALISGIEKFG